MKGIFVILALCLVACHAGRVPRPPIKFRVQSVTEVETEPEGEEEIRTIIDDLKQMMIDANVALEQQIEIIVHEPLQQVDQGVQSIEARAAESAECVSAQEQVVNEIVDQMDADMNACGATAAQESYAIANDVSAAAQQLIFDGYDLLVTYERCSQYTSSILKNACFAKWTVQATLYLNNARKSIQVIKESINERIPNVAIESRICTQTAADTALTGFESIHTNIDACIGITN